MTRLVLALLIVPAALSAQHADTVRLAQLQARAQAADPRDAQRTLLAAQSRLRLANIASERRPSLAVEAVAQYQSDVARIPVTLPGVG